MLRHGGIEVSIGSVGDRYDNAVCETFHAWAAAGPLSDEAGLRQIKLADVARGVVYEATPLRFHDREPVFAPDGRYLAFLSRRTFDPVYDQLRFDCRFRLPLVPTSFASARQRPDRWHRRWLLGLPWDSPEADADAVRAGTVAGSGKSSAAGGKPEAGGVNEVVVEPGGLAAAGRAARGRRPAGRIAGGRRRARVAAFAGGRRARRGPSQTLRRRGLDALNPESRRPDSNRGPLHYE